MKKVLLTGAAGQIGSELTAALRKKYGDSQVVASDCKAEAGEKLGRSGPFEVLDVLDARALADTVSRYGIDTIFHLAAILSAVGESNPQKAWTVNMNGLHNVLEVAREAGCSVFTPSSIAAFGPDTPVENTPQDTIQRPTTIYGVSKVAGELLSDYYHHRFGVDTRGVRYPGIISNDTLPGGGTTDYAVDIFYAAIRHRRYTCFLKPDTRLDMMYMPDAIDAAITLMEADPANLRHRNAFNVTAMNFTPAEIAAEIQRVIPEFIMEYHVDSIRQAIADSWPDSMDDSAARREWGWNPRYDLRSMTEDMLEVLSSKLSC